MSDATWPIKQFYIQSKIGLDNYALTVAGENVTLKRLAGGLEHLWEAEPDPRGGAFLRHVRTKKFLTTTLPKKVFTNPMLFYLGVNKVFPVKVADRDRGDVQQLFQCDDYDQKKGNQLDWVGIAPRWDWNYRLNVPRSDVTKSLITFYWDGGDDNETWKLIEETGKVETESVDFDRNSLVEDKSLMPVTSDTVDVENNGTTNYTGGRTLKHSVTTSHSSSSSESDTDGRTYSQTFTEKVTVDKIYEAAISVGFGQSHSKTTSEGVEESNSVTKTDEITVKCDVPPGKKYRYVLMVYYGQKSMNYTEHKIFKPSAPQYPPYRWDSPGVYTGIDETRSEIVIMDVTGDSEDHKVVDRRPGSV